MKRTTPSFRSNAERTTANTLTGWKVDWEFETKRIPYTSRVKSGMCHKCGSVEVVQKRIYTPDFWLPSLRFFVEVKGRLDSPTRKKMRDIKLANPKLDVRLFLLADNKIKPSKPERYSDWCKKFGFIYCIKQLDKSWFMT